MGARRHSGLGALPLPFGERAGLRGDETRYSSLRAGLRATFIAGIISFALQLATPVDIYVASASYESHAISAGQLAGAGLVSTICGSVCSGLWGAGLGALGALPARLIWDPAEG